METCRSYDKLYKYNFNISAFVGFYCVNPKYIHCKMISFHPNPLHTTDLPSYKHIAANIYSTSMPSVLFTHSKIHSSLLDPPEHWHDVSSFSGIHESPLIHSIHLTSKSQVILRYAYTYHANPPLRLRN